MTGPETTVFTLDAAYKPFPAFKEWASRTSVDEVRWNRYKAELQNRPAASSETLRRAYEVVKRAAALDTGAIEGLYQVDRRFTFTVAFETAAWELELAKRGENVRPLFEAQLQAYDYVLDLATSAEPISEAAIRKLHEVVCSAQETFAVQTAIGPQQQQLVKGRYKVLPDHVRTRDGVDHSYAPVDVTPAEMARLVSEMRTDAFQKAHPVIQAAYAHYGLVVIHPFTDGNGRVARALASAFTYRAISMPIVILSEHKEAYLNALEAADSGSHQAFVDFMLTRSLDTMMLVLESLRSAAVPSLEEAADNVNRLFVTRGGFTHAQVDEGGGRLFQLLENEADKIASIVNNQNLKVRISRAIAPGVRTQPPSGYRLPLGEKQFTYLVVELASSAPAQARIARSFLIWLPVDTAGEDDLRIVEVKSESPQATLVTAQNVFFARMDEVFPAISGTLVIRMSIFVDCVIREMLSELSKTAEMSLRPGHRE